MHRAQGKQKTIKQEEHNSLCPLYINSNLLLIIKYVNVIQEEFVVG